MARVNGSNNAGRLAILAALAGCDPVDGGAAELSWKLRPTSSAIEDKFVECDAKRLGTGPIVAMQLVWQAGTRGGVEEWPCDDSHGVTGFSLPVGPTQFAVLPICDFGPADGTSFIAPAVEERNVILGNTVSLGAVELIVHVTDCDVHTCICAPR
jgi:hypothetical protein